jgi:hypothetical protein
MFYGIIIPRQNSSDPLNPDHMSFLPLEPDHTLLVLIMLGNMFLGLMYMEYAKKNEELETD